MRNPLPVLLALALGACYGGGRDTLDPAVPDEPGACSEDEALRLYRHRIEPLLTDQRPSSCNACHLTGLNLNDFVRGTACQSMACLVDKELVDFAAPEQSLILKWIERAGGKGGPTAAAAEAERAGFDEWIRYSARCHTRICGEIAEPCATRTPGDAGPPDAAAPADGGPDAHTADAAPADGAPSDAAATDAGRPDAARPADAGLDAATDAAADAGSPDAAEGEGPCDPPALVALFEERIYRWKGRCDHCHSADGITAGLRGAPLWLVEVPRGEPERPAIRRTMQNVIEWGLLDLAAPDQSLLLLKPLAEAAGGLRHGGGTKFQNLEDPAYLDFRAWIEHYAGCADGVRPDAGAPPDAGHPADAGAPDPGVDPLVRRYCDCMLVTCHDLYHELYGAEEEVARANCFAVAAAQPRAGALVREGRFLECRLWACGEAERDPAFCHPAGGGGVCSEE